MVVLKDIVNTSEIYLLIMYRLSTDKGRLLGEGRSQIPLIHVPVCTQLLRGTLNKLLDFSMPQLTICEMGRIYYPVSLIVT